MPSSLGPRERLPYELGGVLGRGGMGEVRSAHDPRLDRDLAVKMVDPGDVANGARLAREAAITARLEHPGIMPVYAAGVDPSGRAWYAMRRFQGTSLADRLAAAPDLPARLTLVRHVLNASEAVAYAHSQGVLHRDLKPANLMTGQFGETLVADWGLACSLEEGRSAGSGIGTPGYMSPEQLACAPCDERSDVYGLGAVLRELLTGRPPDLSTGSAMAGVPEAAPVELVAIAARALRADPAGRYPTAKAFAADLLAWFEGRRVSAVDYTLGEAARLLFRAWRIPLRVAAVVSAIFIVVVGISGWRTMAEQARAEESERAATRARAAEAVAFAAALRAQASTALEAGLTLEPRVLAAGSLARHEDPDGRGVLAAVFGRHRLDLLRPALPIPDCWRRALAADATHAACVTGSELRFFDASTGALLSRASSNAVRLDFAGPDDVVAVGSDGRIWAWHPPSPPVIVESIRSRTGEVGDTLVPGFVPVTRDTSEVVVDVRRGVAVESRTCVNAVVKATAIDAEGVLLVGCHDGRVVRAEAGGPRTMFTVDAADGVPYRIVPRGDGRLLVGTYTGMGLVFSPEGTLLARRSLGADGVWSASWRGDDALVVLADGTEALWDTARDRVWGRLGLPFSAFSWTAEGNLRAFGAELTDRDALAPVRLHRIPLGAGITSVAWSPDSAQVAASMADGHVALVGAVEGVVDRLVELERVVVKDVTYSGDGSEVLVAMAGQASLRLSRAGDLLAAVPGGARRAGWMDGIGVIFLGYGPRVLTWAPGREVVANTDRGFTELEVDWDRRHAVALSHDDSLWFGSPADNGKILWRWVHRFPTTSAAAAIGENAVVGSLDDFVEMDAEARVRWRVPLGQQPCAFAVDPSRTLVAVGLLDGTTSVYRRGGSTPIAKLRGHRARLGGLAFSGDGKWLASGGWDGDLRLWSVEAFSADVAATVEGVAAATGRPLDEILGTPGSPR